jgi:hypothetical protein
VTVGSWDGTAMQRRRSCEEEVVQPRSLRWHLAVLTMAPSAMTLRTLIFRSLFIHPSPGVLPSWLLGFLIHQISRVERRWGAGVSAALSEPRSAPGIPRLPRRSSLAGGSAHDLTGPLSNPHKLSFQILDGRLCKPFAASRSHSEDRSNGDGRGDVSRLVAGSCGKSKHWPLSNMNTAPIDADGVGPPTTSRSHWSHRRHGGMP